MNSGRWGKLRQNPVAVGVGLLLAVLFAPIVLAVGVFALLLAVLVAVFTPGNATTLRGPSGNKVNSKEGDQ